MKKPIVLLLAALSFGGLLPGIESAGLAAEDAGAASFNAEQAGNFVSFFSNPFSYDAKISGYDVSAYGLRLPVVFDVHEEVSSSARWTKASMAVQVGTETASQDLFDSYAVRGSDGNALIRSLNTSNATYDTPVVDSDSNPVSFDEAYVNFFGSLLTVSPSAFSTYFEVSLADEGYLVTPTALGLSRLSAGLDAFLLDVLPASFDAKSHAVDYLGLTFTTDESGIPTGLGFDRLDTDRFGGLRATYEVRLSGLEEVTPYPTVAPSLEAEDASLLSSSFEKLATAMAGGNFTETVSFSANVDGTLYPVLSYANYYDLHGIGLMLSSLEYTDTSNGSTFVGLWANEALTQYIPVAISPATETFAMTIGGDSTQILTDVKDAVPTIMNLSTDFFAKGGSGFSYQIAGNLYADYTFQMELLQDLLGPGDYFSHRDGSSLYQLDSSGYELSFTRLDVSLDGDGYPTFVLIFDSALGVEAVATYSFSDFGTTDLASVKDEKGNLLFEDSLEVYDLYDRIPVAM